MKTLKINSFLLSLLLIVGLLFTSCVDDDFGLPNLGDGEPAQIDGTVEELSSILGRIVQNEGEVQRLGFENDLYTSGYVVSTDEGGNFFRELWIQDKPENPTAAIRISVDVSPLFARFNIGRKIFVKLDGLAIGLDSGNPSIGIQNGDRINRIPQGQANNVLIRDNVTEQIVPKVVDMNSLNRSLIGQYVRFENTQFPLGNVSPGNHLTFAGEPNDQFDAERTLQSCESNATLQVATSTFADFKGLKLPTAAGSIEGVLLRAFADANNILKLNTTEGINFDQDRCDPEPLCEGPSGGNDVIFLEDFEGINNIAGLTGWINVNTTGGTVNWRTGSFSNNTYVQISGFNSGQEYDSWLVTPEINLSNSSLEEVRLDLEASFDNGSGLSVLVTENYTGDVLTTDWQELEGIEVPQGPSSGFGGIGPAGSENISCLENVRFAFRYQGSDPDGVTTRYHVDNVRIVGEAN